MTCPILQGGHNKKPRMMALKTEPSTVHHVR